jgi:hypothetical protein
MSQMTTIMAPAGSWILAYTALGDGASVRVTNRSTWSGLLVRVGSNALITDPANAPAGFVKPLQHLDLTGLVSGDNVFLQSATASVGCATLEVGDENQNNGRVLIASGSITRAATTTAYATGQIIAQSATAGSCSAVPMAVASSNDRPGLIRRLRLKINDTAWLSAVVRVHLFQNNPTYAVGDGSAFAGNLTESEYIGYGDVTLNEQFSDPFVKGIGVPAVGLEWNFQPSLGTQNVFAVFEARGAVTPAASKVFTLEAEALAGL